ncbi:SpoIIE family protein phosphatase [Actinoplanes sp. TRM 88003]|uniref:SpoIIE family protein phosphatase n=1 Tax=Paractinoplanes aksuensis TaxID=2939490 RepID=A0ABT1DK02_9ACTN|nr:SpoIIE family protein phosphatase [Actinoplanes aksuensis]MCO8271145.1 SpoIIE family protein phosphatase [Actinoplanes aksuensis]
MADDEVAHVVREMLSVIPAGCSWLLPVTSADGLVCDFRVAATSGHGHDIHRRGTSRIDHLLSELYPGIVGGPLWQLYLEVERTGEPAEMREFRYDEKQAGVVAHSLFDVTVHRVLGGLLVWWQRLDEDRHRLRRTEQLASLGWSEYDLVTGDVGWSPGMYKIFERDRELGPLARGEQAAAMLDEDRRLAETAWQTLDSGAASDITARFRIGPEIKHLRILSDTVNDADGHPVKINAVVQDVTARENTRTAIDRLRDQLHSREMTALAEHRLAAQLQNLIQPVPRDPLPLPGLQVLVNYRPAENTVRVGGDWYHADRLPTGQVVLAVGDVAGHGLGAANGMAHLRFALIAWLSIGLHDPAQLMTHLNRLCGQLGLTGTAVLSVYDPATRELSWARAGHAAPLLARNGEAAPLARPEGRLLGADNESYYEVHRPCLAPHDLLLLYTDGLVERRGGPTLLPEVLDALAEASRQPDTVGALYTRLNRPSPDDDTCTLLVEVT